MVSIIGPEKVIPLFGRSFSTLSILLNRGECKGIDISAMAKGGSPQNDDIGGLAQAQVVIKSIKKILVVKKQCQED